MKTSLEKGLCRRTARPEDGVSWPSTLRHFVVERLPATRDTSCVSLLQASGARPSPTPPSPYIRDGAEKCDKDSSRQGPKLLESCVPQPVLAGGWQSDDGVGRLGTCWSPVPFRLLAPRGSLRSAAFGLPPRRAMPRPPGAWPSVPHRGGSRAAQRARTRTRRKGAPWGLSRARSVHGPARPPESERQPRTDPELRSLQDRSRPSPRARTRMDSAILTAQNRAGPLIRCVSPAVRRSSFRRREVPEFRHGLGEALADSAEDLCGAEVVELRVGNTGLEHLAFALG